MNKYTKKVFDDGTVYYLNGQIHREDGPAQEWKDGTKEWWLNGKHHRTDGPAIEYGDGTKSWYLDGKKLTEETFKKKIAKLK